MFRPDLIGHLQGSHVSENKPTVNSIVQLVSVEFCECNIFAWKIYNVKFIGRVFFSLEKFINR